MDVDVCLNFTPLLDFSNNIFKKKLNLEQEEEGPKEKCKMPYDKIYVFWGANAVNVVAPHTLFAQVHVSIYNTMRN